VACLIDSLRIASINGGLGAARAARRVGTRNISRLARTLRATS
jgi:hypothetical protein